MHESTPISRSRRLIRPGWPGLGLLLGLMVAVLIPAPAASAQQRYEMSQEGWQQLPAPDPGSPEGRLQTIRRLLAEEKPDKAEKLADEWIEALSSHPMAVEAYLLRGDARTAQHKYYRALFDYEYLARRYPASEQFMEALEREFQIARLYVNGLNRRLMGLRILPSEGEGEELLIRIQERAPGSEVGERAHLLLADHYYASGQMTLAADAYDLFLQNYPQSSNRELALLRVIQANLARYKGPAYDQRGLLEAQQRLKLYAAEYPAAAEQIGAAALGIRIRESLARRDLLTARWYQRRGEKLSAVVLYRRVVEDYPDTAAAGAGVDAMRALGEPVVVASPRPAENGTDPIAP